jgi:propane monooxygenase coupling protein
MMAITEKVRQFGQADHTSSNQCGVTLMNNQNGYTIANVMASKPGVTIRELPSMIRVDGIGKIDFDMDEISEAVGFEFAPHDFEEVMSTHYGRMVVLDDHVLLFANPEDGAEYLGFDLKPVN